MEFVPGICPSCNGQLQLPTDRETVKCMYCGSDIRVNQAQSAYGAQSASAPLWGSGTPAPFASGPSSPPPSGMSNRAKLAVAAVAAVAILLIAGVIALVVIWRVTRSPQVATRATGQISVQPAAPKAQAPATDDKDDANSDDSDNTGSETSDTGMNGLLAKIASDGGTSPEAVLANLQAADTKITYPMLKKDADRYAGQPWTLKGKILQIFESGNHTHARVALDSWGNDVVWVQGNFSTDFVEKNQVCVIGYLAGSYSYKSQAGWDITIPALAARAMVSPQELSKLKAEAALQDPAVREANAKRQQAAQAQRQAAQAQSDRRAKAEKLLNQ